MKFGRFSMKKGIVAGILIAFVSFAALAESSPINANDAVPPPPVVSGLRATMNGATVTLEWVPAPNVEGDNIVLRAERPITTANYASAERLASLPVTTQSWSETIADGIEFYYAILTRQKDGTYFEFFLPASNSLLVPVSSGKDSTPAPEAVITAFSAITRNDAVIVTWNASLKDKNLVLYRSTSVFTGMASLVQAIVVSSFQDSSAPYVDYPVPGVPYYYAVLDEDSIRSGTAKFLTDMNTNRIPVEIPASYIKIQRSLLPVLRPMPLPWLNPTQEVSVPASRFSKETEAMIAALPLPLAKKKERQNEPYFFRSDLDSASGGEEYALNKILDATFPDKSWDRAISELTDFLAIRRTDDTIARTRFYLGEAYYFSGDYRKALLEFLLAQDRYYNQSQEWIRYTLEKAID